MVHTTSVQVFRQIRNLDHFGTCTTSVHVSGLPLRYIPLRYIDHFGTMLLRYIKSLMRCFRPYLAIQRDTVQIRRRPIDDLFTCLASRVNQRCVADVLLKSIVIAVCR